MAFDPAQVENDPLVKKLRELEQSINAVKHRRGEEPVTIVDAPESLSREAREEAERVVTEQKLDPAATAATVGVLLSQGNEDEAVKLLEPAVEEGDAMAAATLGLIYERRGERLRALELQRRAADQGDHLAAYNLGRMLHEDGDDASAVDVLHHSRDPRAVQLLQDIQVTG